MTKNKLKNKFIVKILFYNTKYINLIFIDTVIQLKEKAMLDLQRAGLNMKPTVITKASTLMRDDIIRNA